MHDPVFGLLVVLAGALWLLACTWEVVTSAGRPVGF